MNVNYQVKKGETKEEWKNRIAEEEAEKRKQRETDLKDGKIHAVFDCDDFGFLLPGYDDLMRLKQALPNLKITCFTIPMDNKFFSSLNAKHFKWSSYKKWARIVNELDWVEVAIHGFAHVPEECDISYEKSITLLKAVENTWKRIDLEYVKLIKAPYWQMSYDFMVACRDRDYVVAIDKNHPRAVPKGLKTYMYNWSFEQPLPISTKYIKGHGHFVGKNANNISDTLHNILVQLPKETQFMFVSEYLKINGSDTEEIEKLYSKEGRENPGENPGDE